METSFLLPVSFQSLHLCNSVLATALPGVFTDQFEIWFTTKPTNLYIHVNVISATQVCSESLIRFYSSSIRFGSELAVLVH